MRRKERAGLLQQVAAPVRPALALATLLAALCAIALLTSATPRAHGQAGARAGDRPNIVVVMTDDQNVDDDVSVMTRVGEDLAAKGVTFQNFFATFPLCCPSRTTYLTGQYAHNHGVEGNGASSDGGFQAFDDAKTTAVALDDAGYDVGLIGKFLNGYPVVAKRDPSIIPAGFDRWFVPLDNVMYDWSADDQGQIREFTGPDQYQTSVYARQAVRFIGGAAARSRPFWLTVATHAPHVERHVPEGPNPRPAPEDYGAFDSAPLPQPPSFNEADVSDKPAFLQRPLLTADEIDRLQNRYRSRLASLLAVDRLVGRLIDKVRRVGELHDTWFLLTSDNGYLLGEHRLVKKVVLYDESVRVPLIIRGPRGALPRGVVRPQITGNIDLSPTILDIAGVQPQLRVDGISLLPLAADARVDADRDILLENRTSQGVRTRRWVYIEHDTDGNSLPDAFELYDMRSDPYQLENLYQESLDPLSHPRLAQTRTQLALRLAALRNCAGHKPPDPCD